MGGIKETSVAAQEYETNKAILDASKAGVEQPKLGKADQTKVKQAKATRLVASTEQVIKSVTDENKAGEIFEMVKEDETETGKSQPATKKMAKKKIKETTSSTPFDESNEARQEAPKTIIQEPKV